VLELFVTLIILGTLCEAVVEWAKDIAPAIEGTKAKVLSLVVGLVLAFGAGQNLFALIGIEFTYPVVGVILSGMVISRGSNYIHDLIKRIGAVQTPAV